MDFLLKFTEMEYHIQSWRHWQKYNSVWFTLTWLILAGQIIYRIKHVCMQSTNIGICMYVHKYVCICNTVLAHIVSPLIRTWGIVWIHKTIYTVCLLYNVRSYSMYIRTYIHMQIHTHRHTYKHTYIQSTGYNTHLAFLMACIQRCISFSEDAANSYDRLSSSSNPTSQHTCIIISKTKRCFTCMYVISEFQTKEWKTVGIIYT